MYLHLGQETVVKTAEIVGIFDMDNTTISKWTRKYLNRAEKDGEIITVTTDLPKTFVVVTKRRDRRKTGGEREKVYLSQISSATLRKRTGYSYTAKQY